MVRGLAGDSGERGLILCSATKSLWASVPTGVNNALVPVRFTGYLVSSSPASYAFLNLKPCGTPTCSISVKRGMATGEGARASIALVQMKPFVMLCPFALLAAMHWGKLPAGASH